MLNRNNLSLNKVGYEENFIYEQELNHYYFSPIVSPQYSWQCIINKEMRTGEHQSLYVCPGESGKWELLLDEQCNVLS